MTIIAVPQIIIFCLLESVILPSPYIFRNRCTSEWATDQRKSLYSRPERLRNPPKCLARWPKERKGRSISKCLVCGTPYSRKRLLMVTDDATSLTVRISIGHPFNDKI